MKVYIDSDGTLHGTMVRDVAGGTIDGVLNVQIDFSWMRGQQPVATIDIFCPLFNITCEAELFTEVAGKQYRLMETPSKLPLTDCPPQV